MSSEEDVITDTQPIEFVVAPESQVEKAVSKEEKKYPEGYHPCVSVGSLADVGSVKPLEWAPDKNDMKKNETFAIPGLDPDVVLWVSSEDQEGYYKALPPSLYRGISEETISNLREDLSSERLLFLQKIDSLEAEEIREHGGLVVRDDEAARVAQRLKEVTKDTVLAQRDFEEAEREKENWEKWKESGKEVVGDANYRWIDVDSEKKGAPVDVMEWGDDGGKALKLPPLDRPVPKLTIKVRTQNGYRFFRYANKPDEVTEGATFRIGFLEERKGVNEEELRSKGMNIVEPNFLRDTFDSYGKINEKTLRWQARGDADRAYKNQATRATAERLVEKIKSL